MTKSECLMPTATRRRARSDAPYQPTANATRSGSDRAAPRDRGTPSRPIRHFLKCSDANHANHGPLGSGKTTLLRHILRIHPAKIAIVMNEFGEIAIDTKVIEGKTCGSLSSAAAVFVVRCSANLRQRSAKSSRKSRPTGLLSKPRGWPSPKRSCSTSRRRCRSADSTASISVIDADMLVRFPELVTLHACKSRAQTFALNKIDLVEQSRTLSGLETKLHEINPTAAIVRTERCRVDPELLFGIPQLREKKVSPPKHKHHLEFEWFTFSSKKNFFAGLL